MIFWLAALLSYANISGASINCTKALHPVYSVHISKIRPTQMEYGEALVTIRANELILEAAKTGLRPREFIIKNKLDKPIPAVISPRGEFFSTDSHHGIAILYKMLGKTADLKLPLEIIRDYRQTKADGTQWTYEEFIFNLQSPVEEGGLAKCQFSKNIKNKSPEARFAYLPTRYDMLANNPLRSLVGSAFSRHKISASAFKDYIEFDVADMIDPSLLTDLSYNDENVRLIADYIFSNSTIVNFLAKHKKTDKNVVL